MVQFLVTWVANFIPIWLLCFLASMYAKKKEVSIYKQAALLAGFSLITTLVNQLHVPVLNATVGLALFFSVILFLFHVVWYNSILLSGIVWSICAFAETIMAVLWTFIQGTPLTTAYFAQDTTMIVTQSFAIIFEVTIFFMLRIIIQKRKDEKKLPQNLAVILFPIASLLTAYYIISTVVDVFSRQVTVGMGVFLAIFLVVINIASLIGNENVRKRYILQNEIDTMEHQEELTVGLLHQQEDHLKEMRIQAHDFKNHLICLRGLIGGNGIPPNSALQYIDELLQTEEHAEPFVGVKNEALRAILTNTAATCEAQGIALRCRVDYSDFSFMFFSDISILFSNALNNAIEACVRNDNERAPWIDFKVLRKDNMLFIQFTNTIYGTIHEENGVLLSTKTHSENHGIGFKNMERVVQKHDGNITVDYDDDTFRLYINLPVGNAQPT